MALAKLLKSQFLLFLDTAKDTTFAASNWARVDKSTIFDLALNPQTTSNDYIDNNLPEEEVDRYQPEMGQEIALYQGNPMFDFIYGMVYELPVGAEVKVPYMLCFGGSEKKAWRGVATVVLGNLNTVDGKITFTLKFNTIEYGTYAVEKGAPTFTAA